MKEFEKLFESFNNLGLNYKRKKYNDEVKNISLILSNILSLYDKGLYESPSDYNLESSKNLNEEELLNISFRDIYILKAELVLLESILKGNKD